MSFAVRSSVETEAAPTKGSRFLCTLEPVSSDDDARAVLSRVRIAYPDASHHCWAWRLAAPAIDRAGDDGEPSGSAGRPILAALTGRELVDTAVIVTRWFGGTKLGVGGLVRAYGGTAAQALDTGVYDEWVARSIIEFTHTHAETGPVERAFAGLDSTELDVDWGAEVTRRIQLPTSEVEALWSALADATNGRITPPD